MPRAAARWPPTLTDLLLAAGPGRPGAGGAARPRAAAGGARAAPPAGRDRAAIRPRAPGLRLTVDPVEFRGFRYQTGVSRDDLRAGRHEELGRGGRYVCGETEPATGLTLYPDAVLRAAPPRAGPRRACSCRSGADPGRGRADCARDGFATVAALGAGTTIRGRGAARCAARISCATARPPSR